MYVVVKPLVLMNVFDTLADVCFDTTTDIMGYEAEWTPKAGGDIQTAIVHYKDPSNFTKLGDQTFDNGHAIIEYKQGDFVGLRESTNENNPEPVRVKINDVWVEFITVRDKKLFDGRLTQVKLMRKNGL